MTNREIGENSAWLAARLITGGIFLLAGIAKVGDTTSFAETIRAFHLLPPEFVTPFALGLPWLEILAGLYLIAGFLSRIAAVATAAMLVVFVIALGDALISGNTAHSCGCFGGLRSNPVVGVLAGGSTIGTWDVIRDLILLALCGIVFWRGPGAWSVDALLARRRDEELDAQVPAHDRRRRA